MKKYFLSLLLVFSYCTLHAQILLRYGAGIDGGWGDANSVVTPYVNFPASVAAPYAGNQVTRVRIGLCQPATNIYVYIKNEAHDAQYVYRQRIESLETGWNEIVLDTPYDLTGEAFSLGYKASFANSGGVGYSSEKFSDGDIVYYNSKNRWTSTGGSVCIHAVVEGDALPQNELQMGRLGNQTAPYDADEMTFTGTVRNVGGNDVANYILGYTYDDEDNRYLTFDGMLAVNATDTFAITVPSATPGTHSLRVWVSQVNGTDDAYSANNEASATLLVRDPVFRRNVVCEEFTGLWCGWCPRGMVGLDLMLERYPNQFIPISVHGSGGDPMEIDSTLSYTYRPFIDQMSGAPSCKVDRKVGGDPFYDIQSLFDTETSADAAIALTTQAVWNADSTAIDLDTEYFSGQDLSGLSYNIAYVLTEDSITGYGQTNYYAGGGEFYGWEQKSGTTTDCYFNYVARGIYGQYDGDELLRGDLTAYDTQYAAYTLTIPMTVADKRQLNVVTMVVDSSTGYIVNAFRTSPIGLTDGISHAKVCQQSPTRVYNILGQPVAADSRGLRIIVQDGRARKVFVR